MKILAIETSCDETGISVVEQQTDSSTITLLGNALASQIELHAQYGGVFPAMAKRAHAEKIIPLTIEALIEANLLTKESSTTGTEARAHIEELCTREQEMIEVLVDFFDTYKKPELDYIAVTVGPGLEPALWVGINTARVLGAIWNIPIIPINHMEGHVVTAAIEEQLTEITGTDQKQYIFKDLSFPLLSLLVSGGHTELVLAYSYGHYDKIGQTRDDAVGEAFDKVARMLGLPYPGGPAVSKLAATFRAKNSENFFTLPRPMLHSQDYDFSYSGIKTAALYTIRDLTEQNTRPLTEDEKMALAAAFEDAAIEVLVKKTIRAAEEYGVQTVIVGGGVAGNTYLKNQLTTHLKAWLPSVEVLFPAPWLATDNAVMIAMATVARIKVGTIQTTLPEDLKANGNLSLATD
ncbi:tRNA (adenosine(37)-N6)-threonylcarbamoyltransferase complex transferase subunit TsaD [Patescibacteria group bacterium]|nr:tRNA (adenosine(37)-N6)-threonylcarbamoyltransferase complex transferase subunit TsaD [Patescibacteria group bacterium]